jgi:hypothetical protein
MTDIDWGRIVIDERTRRCGGVAKKGPDADELLELYLVTVQQLQNLHGILQVVLEMADAGASPSKCADTDLKRLIHVSCQNVARALMLAKGIAMIKGVEYPPLKIRSPEGK